MNIKDIESYLIIEIFSIAKVLFLFCNVKFLKAFYSVSSWMFCSEINNVFLREREIEQEKHFSKREWEKILSSPSHLEINISRFHIILLLKS